MSLRPDLPDSFHCSSSLLSEVADDMLRISSAESDLRRVSLTVDLRRKIKLLLMARISFIAPSDQASIDSCIHRDCSSASDDDAEEIALKEVLMFFDDLLYDLSYASIRSNPDHSISPVIEAIKAQNFHLSIDGQCFNSRILSIGEAEIKKFGFDAYDVEYKWFRLTSKTHNFMNKEPSSFVTPLDKDSSKFGHILFRNKGARMRTIFDDVGSRIVVVLSQEGREPRYGITDVIAASAEMEEDVARITAKQNIEFRLVSKVTGNPMKITVKKTGLAISEKMYPELQWVISDYSYENPIFIEQSIVDHISFLVIIGSHRFALRATSGAQRDHIVAIIWKLYGINRPVYNNEGPKSCLMQ